MNIFFLLILIFLSSDVWLAPTPCRVPKDLEANYEKLKGYQLLTLSIEQNRSPSHTTDTKEYKCPNDEIHGGYIEHRSTCPWVNEVVTDEELFPSNYTVAHCLCENCTGLNSSYGCEPVTVDMIFLKRTGCMNGFYVYEAFENKVKTGCVCSRKDQNYI